MKEADMPGCEARVARTGLGMLVVLWLGACNLVSGADDITLTDEDDDSSNGNGGDVTAGAGQGGSGNATTGAGAGATAAATGATTTTTGAGGATASSSGGTGATGPCEWPTGTPGIDVGQTVPETKSWQGYDVGPSSLGATTVAIADLFDCDGSKGINAIMVETSQYG